VGLAVFEDLQEMWEEIRLVYSIDETGELGMRRIPASEVEDFYGKKVRLRLRLDGGLVTVNGKLASIIDDILTKPVVLTNVTDNVATISVSNTIQNVSFYEIYTEEE
jgi:hypothetical protein